MSRNRFAALLLGLGTLGFLGLALHLLQVGDPAAALAPLALAGLHGTLGVGVARQRVWARWFAMGLAFFWALSALIVTGPASGFAEPGLERWALLLLHAPLPLCLARPDDAHPRTSVSLLLTGAALAPALILVAQAIGALDPSWIVIGGGALATAGACGLARGRTWGLLTVGLAGVALSLAGPLEPRALGAPEMPGLVGLLLIAAGLPFANPVAAWLRGRSV